MAQFVSIPGPGRSHGRPSMFMPSKMPGQPTFFPKPQANNQTLGFDTNDRCCYGFMKQSLGNKAWNEAIVRDSFVFLLSDPTLLPIEVGRQVRYGGASSKSKSVLLTLQQANYLLAANSDKVKNVEAVYNSIKPLGVNTTADPENKMSRPVMNVVVGGNVETTFNLWGNKYPAMAKAYFVIKKVRVKAGSSLKYVLSTTGAEIERVSGGEEGKDIYQLIPWASVNGVEPFGANVEGFYKIGSIVQASALKDMATLDKYDNANDRISRDMPEVLSKSRMVKVFLNIF